MSGFLFFQGNLALGSSPISPSCAFWWYWMWWYFWSSLRWFCSPSCSPSTRSPTAASCSYRPKPWVSVRPGWPWTVHCHCVPGCNVSFLRNLPILGVGRLISQCGLGYGTATVTPSFSALITTKVSFLLAVPVHHHSGVALLPVTFTLEPHLMERPVSRPWTVAVCRKRAMTEMLTPTASAWHCHTSFWPLLISWSRSLGHSWVQQGIWEENAGSERGVFSKPNTLYSGIFISRLSSLVIVMLRPALHYPPITGQWQGLDRCFLSEFST